MYRSTDGGEAVIVEALSLGGACLAAGFLAGRWVYRDELDRPEQRSPRFVFEPIAGGEYLLKDGGTALLTAWGLHGARYRRDGVTYDMSRAEFSASVVGFYDCGERAVMSIIRDELRDPQCAHAVSIIKENIYKNRR